MAEQDIIVRIKAEGTDAFVKQLKEAGIAVDKVGDEAEETEKQVKKTTSSMSSSFKKLGGVIAAAFATQQIANFIKESVKLADIQLKAEAQLLKGLKGRQDIQKRLIQQAKQLQSTTTFGDEQIIAQQAYLANLEFSEEQIKKIIKASVDLSAGANIPLESSVRNLAKSYSGLSGELGELIPQLRDLTQDQLKNGEGVKVITELYKGQAGVLRNTGLGAVQSLQNAVGDLQEELGRAVFQGLTPLADSLQGLAENENVLAFFRNIGVVLADALQAAGFALEVVARLGGDLADLFGLGDESTTTSLEKLNERLAEEEKLLNDAIDAKERLSKVRVEEIDEIEKLVASGKTLNSDQVDRLQSIYDERNAIEDAISLRQSQVKSIKSIIEARERAAKGLKNLITPLSNTEVNLSSLQQTIDIEGESVSELARRLEILNDAFRVTKTVAEEFQETLLDGTDLQISDSTQALIDKTNELTESLKRLGFQTRQNKEDEADAIALQNERISKAQEGFGQIQELQAGAFNAFSAFNQAEIAELDRRFEQGLIGEKEYQKERRNLQRKQAKADKAEAIFNATVNIATGITQALTRIGSGGLALAAIVAATGAAQIAAIAKTPIPKFRKGTQYVGDGYELGEDRTLAWLNKGERVIAADKNKTHFKLYDAIEDNDVDGIMNEMAKMGIAVQFNAGDAISDQISQLKTLQQIQGNGKNKGLDISPLLHASDRQRVTLSHKLDRVNDNLVRLGSVLGRTMTKA